MVVIHATAVVAEVTQCLSNFRLASPLSYQIPEGIYHFVDTVGIAAKSMALALKPLGTGLFIRPKCGISSTLEMLYGMPEIEHFDIGVEAFGERPIALFTICGDHQFQVRILAQQMVQFRADLCFETLLLRLMHFVQMALNFDKMSRKINHDLQDADGV